MTNVNRRIFETIDKSKYPVEIKTLLKTLLSIELRNSQNRTSLYSRDYDTIISKAVDKRNEELLK